MTHQVLLTSLFPSFKQIRLMTPSLEKFSLGCQDNSVQARFADSSSTDAVSFSSACTTKGFPLSRCDLCPLLLLFAAFKKWLAKPERYCQSHCRHRAHKSFRGTIRGSRTSVSASMAQAPSRDFLYSVTDPQPLAFRKRGLI